MIAVLVSQEDAGECFRGTPDTREAIADLASAETGVNEQARVIRLQVGAIASGAAAQNGETDRHALTLEIGGGSGKGIRVAILGAGLILLFISESRIKIRIGIEMNRYPSVDGFPSVS